MPRRNHRRSVQKLTAAWVALSKEPAEATLEMIKQVREDTVRIHMHNAANMLDDAARLAAKGQHEQAQLWRQIARIAIRQDRAFLAIHAALRDLREGVDRPGILRCDILKVRPTLVMKRDCALPEARSLEKTAKKGDDDGELRSHARWLRALHKGVVVALALLDEIVRLDAPPPKSRKPDGHGGAPPETRPAERTIDDLIAEGSMLQPHVVGNDLGIGYDVAERLIREAGAAVVPQFAIKCPKLDCVTMRDRSVLDPVNCPNSGTIRA